MKKIFYILIILASIYISNNLIQSIYNLLQKKDLVTQAKVELSQERNEYEKLKDQLQKVKRVDYIEEEARNKLFMVQPGEQIVLVPHEILNATDEAEIIAAEKQPTWKLWLEIFFKPEH